MAQALNEDGRTPFSGAALCSGVDTLPVLAQASAGPRPETMIFSKNGNYKKTHKNYISAVFKITQKLFQIYIDMFAVLKVTKKQFLHFKHHLHHFAVQFAFFLFFCFFCNFENCKTCQHNF